MVTKPGIPEDRLNYLRMLTCYRELVDAAFSASPESAVHAEALPVFFKLLYRCILISINFPDACILGILAVVIYETLHILKGIAKKDPYFMRKSHLIRLLTGQAAHEVIKTAPDTALG